MISVTNNTIYQACGLPQNASKEEIKGEIQELKRESGMFSSSIEKIQGKMRLSGQKIGRLEMQNFTLSLPIDSNPGYKWKDLLYSAKDSYICLLKTFFSGESRSAIIENNTLLIDYYRAEIRDLQNQRAKAISTYVNNDICAETLELSLLPPTIVSATERC